MSDFSTFKTSEQKAKRIFILIGALILIFVAYNRGVILINADLLPAKIIDCGSEWVEVSDSHGSGSARYRETVQYYPIAESSNGEKVFGDIMVPTRALCSQQVGNNVSVLIHHVDPTKNSIYTFLQFWALSVFFLLFPIAWLVMHYFPRAGRIFVTFYYLAFIYLVSNELGLIEKYMPDISINDPNNIKSSTNTNKLTSAQKRSKAALDRCVWSSLRKEFTDKREYLNKLVCQGEDISDLSSIADLTHLEALYLQNNKLMSLEGLKPLTSLKIISVASNKTLTSTKGIEHLTLLEEFQANKSGLKDLSGMEKLINLKVIGAMMNDINNITPLQHLSELTNVTLSYNHINNITALANKPKLTRLTLYDNPLGNISPLLTNKALTLLGVSGSAAIKCELIYQLREQQGSKSKIYGPKRCNINYKPN